MPRINIDLPTDLHDDIKHRAIDEKLTLEKTVILLLRIGVSMKTTAEFKTIVGGRHGR